MTGSAGLLEALARGTRTRTPRCFADILDVLHGSSPAPQSGPGCRRRRSSARRAAGCCGTCRPTMSRPGDRRRKLSSRAHRQRARPQHLRKLQVRDRSSAVRRARELRLLGGRPEHASPAGNPIWLCASTCPPRPWPMTPLPPRHVIRIDAAIGATMLSAFRHGARPARRAHRGSGLAGTRSRAVRRAGRDRGRSGLDHARATESSPRTAESTGISHHPTRDGARPSGGVRFATRGCPPMASAPARPARRPSPPPPNRRAHGRSA